MKKEFIILLAATFLIVGCGKGTKGKGKSSKTRVENVEVLKLSNREIDRVVEYSTILEGYEQINVSPSVQGIIEHIYVEPGTKVSKGQLIARMDQTQLNAAKIQKNTLGVELSRTEALLKSGNIAQSIYDQLKTQYDVAESNLNFLQKNTFVRAPFAGTVIAKNYENGEMYSPAKPIVQIAQISRLKAYINVPETYFHEIKRNMSVEILSDIYKGDVFNGRVEIVYPAMDPASHTFKVKINIPNSSRKLRPGMFVKTSLAFDKVDALLVPYQTVLKQQGSNDRYVFIRDNDRAKYVSVRLGQRFDDMTEIISDSIKVGDEIIVVGQSRLIDGVKVNVVDPGN